MIDFNKLENAPKITVTYNFDDIDGNYIKSFRTNNNLTQPALANIFNVSIKTIQRWESGKQKVTGPAITLFTLFNSDKNLLSKIREVTYPIKQLDTDCVEVENLSDNIIYIDTDITTVGNYDIARRERPIISVVVNSRYKDRFITCERKIDGVKGFYDNKQCIFIPFESNERTEAEKVACSKLGLAWSDIFKWKITNI